MRGALTAVIACGVLLLIAPVAGATNEVCNPTPKANSSFCVTYGAAFSTQQAAAPFSTDVSLADTSTSHDGDVNRWLDHGVIDLNSGGATGPPIFTPSSQLPNNLLIAGGGPCTSPNFTDCGGGHGAVLGSVQNNLFIPNGTFTGTFGVSKVVNVNPPPPGDAVKWMLTFQYCIDGICGLPPQQVPLEVPTSGTGPVDPQLHMLLRTTIDLSGAGGGSADVSVDTASLHWNSQSDQADGGGTLPQPAVIARMPLRCGTDNGAASIFDVAATSVSIGQSFTVTGCPTARFSATPDGWRSISTRAHPALRSRGARSRSGRGTSATARRERRPSPPSATLTRPTATTPSSFGLPIRPGL